MQPHPTASVSIVIHNVQITWITSILKRSSAFEKIYQMRAQIGYPDGCFDDENIEKTYRELEIYPGSYYNSSLNITRFIRNLEFTSIESSHWGCNRDWTSARTEYLPSSNVIGKFL